MPDESYLIDKNDIELNFDVFKIEALSDLNRWKFMLMNLNVLVKMFNDYGRKDMDKKYKIGYLPGSWDLFHAGHLNIIKKAKSLCDKLIVAVSTDELVRAKGVNLIIPLWQRLEIVAAIRYVDEVVTQIDHNKFAAWEKYHFDVIFGGDDLKGSERWNLLEQQFSAEGVDVMYFPYTKEISSTMIREALGRRNLDPNT